MDNIRHEFREFAIFWRDTLVPAFSKKFELESKIRDLLFSKYRGLANKLFLENIPEVKSGTCKKEDVVFDTTFLEIVDAQSSSADISLTTFIFRIKYYIKSEQTYGCDINPKTLTIRPKLTLRFFSNYIPGDEKDIDFDC